MFCQKMKELVDNQTLYIERAFTLDTGPYGVSDAYCQNKENPRKWVKQSKAYWQKVIKRIHRINLLPRPSIDMSAQLTNSNTSTSGSSSSLAIQHDDSVTGDNTKQMPYLFLSHGRMLGFLKKSLGECGRKQLV